MFGRRPSAGRLRGFAVAGVATIAATFALAAPATAQPLYGVVPQDNALPAGEDLELMPSGGVDSIRLMAHWPSAEDIDGIYDWSSLDGMVRESIKRGIDPLPYFFGTPDWAARRDGHSCGRDDCSLYPPSSAETRKAFADFAAAAVERYGPDGDFWKPPVQATTSTLPCDLPICPPPPPPPPAPPPPPPPPPPLRPLRLSPPSPLRPRPPAAAPSRAPSASGRSGTSRTRPSSSRRHRMSASTRRC